MYHKIAFLFLILYIVALTSADDDDEDCMNKGGVKETLKRLKTDVLCGYDRSIRPVREKKTSLKVNLRLLLKFFDFNDHLNQMSLNFWLVINWKDEYLKWKPTDYDGLKTIHLQTTEVWVPDISVYNSAEMSNSESAIGETSCLVHYSGIVTCVPPVNHDSVCLPNVKLWPYDTQNCKMQLGSWKHTGEEIEFNLTKPPISIEDFTENREWALVATNASIDPGIQKCCPNQTFPHIDYMIKIKRHAAALTITAVLPNIILVILSIAMMFASWDSTERYFFCGLSLLLHLTYLVNITWVLPANGATCPLILIFFRDSFLLTTFGFIQTMILRCLINSSLSSPNWLISFTSVMVKCRPGQILFLSQLDPRSAAEVTEGNKGEGSELVFNPQKQGCSQEWLLLAKFLDRVTFFVFVLTYSILALTIIPSSS